LACLLGQLIDSKKNPLERKKGEQKLPLKF